MVDESEGSPWGNCPAEGDASTSTFTEFAEEPSFEHVAGTGHGSGSGSGSGAATGADHGKAGSSAFVGDGDDDGDGANEKIKVYNRRSDKIVWTTAVKSRFSCEKMPSTCSENFLKPPR